MILFYFVLFVFTSCYLGLIIRAKIEGIKIHKHLFKIIIFPINMITFPFILIPLPFWVWSALKKEYNLKLKIIFALAFTYAIYKLFFELVFLKFDSIIKIFFIKLKYEEKAYEISFISKFPEKFTKYITRNMRKSNLMRNYVTT